MKTRIILSILTTLLIGVSSSYATETKYDAKITPTQSEIKATSGVKSDITKTAPTKLAGKKVSNDTQTAKVHHHHHHHKHFKHHKHNGHHHHVNDKSKITQSSTVK